MKLYTNQLTTEAQWKLLIETRDKIKHDVCHEVWVQVQAETLNLIWDIVWPTNWNRYSRDVK